MTKPKIYCFVNVRKGSRSLLATAVNERGYCICFTGGKDTDELKKNIGITSDNFHPLYNKKYPDGYELLWYDSHLDLPEKVLDNVMNLASRGDKRPLGIQTNVDELEEPIL